MTDVLNESAVLERFRGVVAKSLRIEAEKITEEAYLDDLGAESLDLIEITMETEEAFGIWISEKTILQTATEVFGPDVLEQSGILTDEGKALLLHRLPEINPASLDREVPMREVNRYFLNVGAWVRMIKSLVENTPQACPQCGGTLKPAISFKLSCTACVAETPMISGEELNRNWVKDYYSKRICAAPQALAAAASLSASVRTSQPSTAPEGLLKPLG